MAVITKMASAREDSLFRTVRVVQHMILPPSYMGRIGAGVIENLNRRILKFSSEHQGFILAYSKPQVLQRAAVIHDEKAGLHFDVQADLYLFAPKVGSTLQGTVNHIQNTTHLGCLVYGCFNATVLRRSKGNHWRKNGIEGGQSITFKVVNLEKVSGVLCIHGKEVKPRGRSYCGEEGRAADVPVLDQQSSQDICEGDFSKRKKVKKKRKKHDHSLNDVSLSSSFSASDMSHCERTVAHANGLSGLSKRKRRIEDRDKASAGDTSGPTSTSGAKREKHQDDKGNEKEECKNEEGGHNSIFLEASAPEHDTKSYRKNHKKGNKKQHKRKHNHCQE